jgi:hypothetical protein
VTCHCPWDVTPLPSLSLHQWMYWQPPSEYIPQVAKQGLVCQLHYGYCKLLQWLATKLGTGVELRTAGCCQAVMSIIAPQSPDGPLCCSNCNTIICEQTVSAIWKADAQSSWRISGLWLATSSCWQHTAQGTDPSNTCGLTSLCWSLYSWGLHMSFWLPMLPAATWPPDVQLPGHITMLLSLVKLHQYLVVPLQCLITSLLSVCRTPCGIS